MPRRVEDILPNDRRSIRDLKNTSKKPAKDEIRRRAPKEPDFDKIEPEVEIPIHRQKPTAPPVAARSISNIPKPIALTPRAPEKRTRPRRRGKWFIITLAIMVVIGGLGYLASSYYSKASFTITPKVIPIAVGGTYVADIASSGKSGLTYELMTISASASTTVPATDGPAQSIKSKGRVTLYNSYSSESVRLIAGTRLSNDTGRVYRLESSVVIPGYTESGGKVNPGFTTTSLIADAAGQEYNIIKGDPESDLSIVAYKGTERYDTIYGKLATNMSGGFVGTQKITDPKAVATSTESLKKALTADLITKAKNSVPDGYIMFANGYVTSFNEPVLSGSAKNSANLELKGTVNGIIFKKSALIDKFSNNQSSSVFGGYGYIDPGLDKIAMSVVNLKDFSPSRKNAVIFHAKGDLKLVAKVPVEEIRKKLAGISLAGTQDVFKTYSAVIESGTGELVPPWAKIPTADNRIIIDVKEK